MIYRDRIGKHFVVNPGWWFNLHIVIGGGTWAGSCWLFRKRLWLKPIDQASTALRS